MLLFTPRRSEAASVWRTAQPALQWLCLFHRVRRDALLSDAASNPSGTCHGVARGSVARHMTALAVSPQRPSCRLGVALKCLQLAAVLPWAVQPAAPTAPAAAPFIVQRAALRGTARPRPTNAAALISTAQHAVRWQRRSPSTARRTPGWRIRQRSTVVGSAARDTAARPVADQQASTLLSGGGNRRRNPPHG
jgi:hypothetical protein